jgi:hypothetical protein
LQRCVVPCVPIVVRLSPFKKRDSVLYRRKSAAKLNTYCRKRDPETRIFAVNAHLRHSWCRRCCHRHREGSFIDHLTLLLPLSSALHELEAFVALVIFIYVAPVVTASSSVNVGSLSVLKHFETQPVHMCNILRVNMRESSSEC